MSLYVKGITVPPDTGKNEPKEYSLHLEGVALTGLGVLIPPGHCAETGIALFYGVKQIAPLPTGVWLKGDDMYIKFPLLFPIYEGQVDLTVKAYNEDITYSHSFILHAKVLSYEEYQIWGITPF